MPATRRRRMMDQSPSRTTRPKPDDAPKPKPDDSPKPKPDDAPKPDDKPKPDPLAPLLKDLRSDNADVKANAVAGLAKLLKGGDDLTRRQAAQALGEAGLAAKAARPNLDDATKDSDKGVRREARKAVAAIDDAFAEEKKKAQIRQKLAPLLKDLKDKSAAVRQKALEGIADMGADGVEASEGLLAMLTDKSPAVQQRALDALEKVNYDLHEPIVALLVDNDKASAVAQLGKMGAAARPAVPTLIGFYQIQAVIPDHQYHYRATILTALYAIDPDNKDFQALVVNAIPVIQASPYPSGLMPDSEVRFQAIICAMKMVKANNLDPARLVKPLLSALGDTVCKLTAIQALGDIGPEAKDALPTLKKLKTDPDKIFRDVATEAVNKIE